MNLRALCVRNQGDPHVSNLRYLDAKEKSIAADRIIAWLGRSVPRPITDSDIPCILQAKSR